MMITIYYDEQDSNRGWAYYIQDADFCESDPLPHRRRNVSMATLARSLRREYRSARPELRRAIASAKFEPCMGGYVALVRGLGPL